MFAIVRTGGQQFKVTADTKISVEKLDHKVGDQVLLQEVLLIGEGDTLTCGTPLVKNASVVALVEEQMRDKKVIIFKKRRRQQYRRKKGHRQQKTVLRVVSINVGDKVLASAPKKVAKVDTAPKTEAKKAAPKKSAEKDSK